MKAHIPIKKEAKKQTGHLRVVFSGSFSYYVIEKRSIRIGDPQLHKASLEMNMTPGEHPSRTSVTNMELLHLVFQSIHGPSRWPVPRCAGKHGTEEDNANYEGAVGWIGTRRPSGTRRLPGRRTQFDTGTNHPWDWPSFVRLHENPWNQPSSFCICKYT